MRTPHVPPVPPATPTVPLLDDSSLPAEEDWAVLESLHPNAEGFDPDEDRFADLGFSAGDFD
jgi:hypothetical protein